MPQVYAAVRSGTHWLIAQKRATNNWWSAIAAPVLVLEAAVLLNTALTAPERRAPTVAAINLLVNAHVAARTAWSKTPEKATAIAAVATAVGDVQTALGVDSVEALQNAIPSVLTAVDRASQAAGFAGRRILATPPITVWPDAALAGRVTTAQQALEKWASEQPQATVNQAGQWALPGGAMGDGESAEAAARREFFEETGVALDPVFVMQRSVAFGYRPGRVAFYLACFAAPPDIDLDELAARLNLNLAPRPEWMGRPASKSVVDWELSRLQVVAQADICSFLGVRQPVEPAPVGRADSQSIDWYAAIARYIEGLPAE